MSGLSMADFGGGDAALAAFVRPAADGAAELNLAVENMHCAACMARIEGALCDLPGVDSARANLSTKRVRVRFDPVRAPPDVVVERVAGLGYRVAPYDPRLLSDAGKAEERELLVALAVAGFAAGNVMLLSVAVWAGSDMGPATRDLFHWISALIALPAVAFAGQPFFRAAWVALKGGGLNMEAPISLAVILGAGMSLYETASGGQHAYFDAAVGLLFFLLLGRYLERRARGQANAAAEQLMLLGAIAAEVLMPDGSRRRLPVGQVQPGMRVYVAPGDRVPVDGVVAAGRSDLDTSLVSGESLPRAAGPGAQVFAGTLNLSSPLEVTVRAAGDETLLAEIVRLMEAAEQGRARYVRLADRLARIYAPVVHLLAAATFLGWLLVAGVTWQAALLSAIAVLIVTCPCALGLAVPAVQVVASGGLLRRGILLKSGDGLERLAAVDTVVLDKTGTLTLGRPELEDVAGHPLEVLALAGGMAAASRHPLARALARAAGVTTPINGVRETPGMGLEVTVDGRRVRLGNRRWCGIDDMAAVCGPELWLAVEGKPSHLFRFDERLRADAADVVAGLRRRGLAVELISGDREAGVRTVAETLGIAHWRAEVRPADKVSRLDALIAAGRRPLMVGDGLNDAPALAAAYVSMSPAAAADVSRAAADLVFQGEALAPVLTAYDTAAAAARLVRQNFALAFLYNVAAVPLAMAGLVTPLVAAIAMSASSLLVTGNALRLGLNRAMRGARWTC